MAQRRGGEIFQTGLNHMLVLAADGQTAPPAELRLESPLARVVTLAMALLVLSALAAIAARPLGRLARRCGLVRAG